VNYQHYPEQPLEEYQYNHEYYLNTLGIYQRVSEMFTKQVQTL
jgi:hypothetical protein